MNTRNHPTRRKLNMIKYIIKKRLSVVYVGIPRQEKLCVNIAVQPHVKQYQMFANTIFKCLMITTKMIYIYIYCDKPNYKKNNAMTI